ncbi:MAG: hypothetical protein ACI9MC_003812 [Kiritimatiellia bacterium]
MDVVATVDELASRDWDGTALVSRFSDDRGWRRAMDAALAANVEIYVISAFDR